jgi:hypothetical protein
MNLIESPNAAHAGARVIDSTLSPAGASIRACPWFNDALRVLLKAELIPRLGAVSVFIRVWSEWSFKPRYYSTALSNLYLLRMKSIVFVGAASSRDGEQVAAGSRSYNKARSYPKA